MLRGSSGADYANTVAALGVGHEQQHSFDHAHPGEAILAVIVAIVVCADAEGVGKDEARTAERDAVFRVVRGGLGLVLLKIAIFHKCTVKQ
jgi:acid phosphatase family membrane protein YuiD